MNETKSPVSVRRQGRVAVVTIDNPPVNATSRAVRAGLIDALATVATDPAVAAIVLTGAGTTFVAGADIKEMGQPPTAPLLSEVVAALDRSEKPVVAALTGAALGGGLELALACDFRIAHPRAAIGLPETRLGIVPGAGGTQRLPRLVGAARAADLIASARILRADEALAAGIVDAVEEDVVAAALSIAPTVAKRRVSTLPVPRDPDRDTSPPPKGKSRSPAQAEATRLVELAASLPFEAGLAEERAAFLALRDSAEAKALRYLFFAERAAADVPGLKDVGARPVASVGVIGAGTMGAAIAATFADAGFKVELVERDQEASRKGSERLADLYRKQVAGGRLAQPQMDQRLGRIHSTDDWQALAGLDLVVEAAFEDMDVKRDIFARLGRLGKPGAVLASNTSYLDLDRIAAASGRPEDVVGLHFFAPANVMKLLEIVRGTTTAPAVLATALAVARKLGKQPVVAGNAHGFIGNRIYSAYRRHAEYLMEDGASPFEIDAAIESFGFAMGVFAVSDLSGLDISYAMRRSLDATRDPGERYVAVADRLVEGGRLGRKSGAGYYSYATGKALPDPETDKIVAAERGRKGISPRSLTPEAIQRRLIAVMANEGAAILEQGIAYRASDIDLVLINGYGFPRSKGGPMWLADQIGAGAIVVECEAARRDNPGSIEVSGLLRRVAASGGNISEWRVSPVH